MATLLVANAGGHLAELVELLPRLDSIDRSHPTWVTFDTEQARSLLAGADVVHAPYSRPRDVMTNLRYAALAHSVLRSRRYTHVISTGSQIAVPFLVQARLRGASCHYIESATRRSAPSLTGRVLARVPGIERYAQVSVWGDPPWHFRGTVFDGYTATPGPRRPIATAAVAAGSSEVYGFRRLLGAAAATLPDDAAVTWQTGSTPVDGLPIEARPGVPSDTLAAEFAAADVVITHAGVGLALLALAAGKCPVVVPRRAGHEEHVDDHQHEIAAELDRRGLAVACEADELTIEVLEKAAARAVTRVAEPPVFELVDGARRP